MGRVSAVKLEPIHPQPAQRFKLGVQPAASRMRAEIHSSRKAIPPFGNKRASGFILQQKALLDRFTVGFAVRRHIGADPQHYLKAQAAQVPQHTRRIWETPFMELPVSITLCPAVVNHQNTRTEATVQNITGIAQYGLLILVKGQFDPCIKNRCFKQLFCGHFSTEWKMPLHRLLISVPQRLFFCGGLHALLPIGV